MKDSSLISYGALSSISQTHSQLQLEKSLKKVLVIAYYFPPMGLSGVQRTLKFVKYLPQFNWKPVVLTINPTSYFAYDESLLEELDERYVEIHRTDTKDVTKAALGFSKSREFKMPKENTRRLLSAISQIFFIPDNKIGWKEFALQKASEIIEQHGDIEMIFSTAPPFSSHLIALELRKKYQLPTIVDFRDPWVENPLHFYASPYHKRKHEHLEEQVLLGADKVITVNRAMKELFLRRYHGKLTHKDVAIITHGFDTEDFIDLPEPKVKSDKMRFLHSGLFHSKERTPIPFFLGLKLAIEKRPELNDFIEARFVGLFPNEYLKVVKKLGLEHIIQVEGYKSHKETIIENLNANVLWATQSDVKYIETITQSKLYEYLACKRTLFGIVPDGASKQFIIEANGVVAHPNNPEEIATQMLSLFDLWTHNNLPIPAEDEVEKYNRRNLTALLAKEFEQLLFV